MTEAASRLSFQINNARFRWVFLGATIVLTVSCYAIFKYSFEPDADHKPRCHISCSLDISATFNRSQQSHLFTGLSVRWFERVCL